MEFEVLGPVAIQHGSLSGRLQSILLGVLLTRANRPVSVDTLADTMWDGPTNGRETQRLQLHVHKLRRALAEPDRVSFVADGYQLRVLPGELDAERFESLVNEATELVGPDPRRCAELLRKALDLWRAEPYQGLDVPILLSEARRLTDRRLVATETLYEAELACGRHAAIAAELAALADEHPLRERLHASLMIALSRSGRQADALAAYRKARATMVDELGVEPGPALRAIEQEILTGGTATFVPENRAPAQLPHNIREFTGRSAELSVLDDLLGSPVIAVTGTAGVGKTTLAVRWAHQIRDRFPDGQLYVDLRGFGPDEPLSAAAALAGFLRALGVHGVPADPAERAARFRTFLDSKRMLLLLDNAKSAGQVRPLLPGTSSCLVLVTSRDTLSGLVAREGAHRIDLERLPASDAFDLVRAVAADRVDAAPEATAMLIDRCARLPLALRVAAELIRTRRGSDVADLVGELASEQGTLDLLDAGGDPQTAVRAVFSWSYRHLSPDAARLFRLLGSCPGPDIELHALAALAGSGLWETQRSLDVLARAHLVEPLPDRRYHVHDLLRAYAIELSEPSREGAVSGLLDWYLYTASRAMDLVAPLEAARRPEIPVPAAATPEFADREDGLRWLDTERATLVLAAGLGRPGYTARISPTLWRYLESGGYNDDALTLHTLALAEAEQRDDLAAQGVALTRLGIAHVRLWHNDIAGSCFEKALSIQESLGDRAAVAAVLNNLGLMYVVSDRLPEAASHYEQALDVERRLEERPYSGTILSNLGDVYRQLGNYSRAADCLDQSHAIIRDTADFPAEAIVLCHLAALCTDLGNYAEALDYLDQTLAAARTTGNHLAVGEAQYQLGLVFSRLGEHERASGHYTEALTSADASGNQKLRARVLAELKG